jgi:hypothetical protein
MCGVAGLNGDNNSLAVSTSSNTLKCQTGGAAWNITTTASDQTCY